ncbi:peptide ABC transporter permease [Aliidongia dinghuensis]|uniref:Peptide ABC transporter permease n=1 Tax=Aliidongia dinghuensis TaxID=1867774 RepID=A0A8J3E5Q2_9PROT|nr:ABC transporter permease [Aliidongia dinghuensis]GGF37570.1 peptide ABC transporter permease [Aliidongia dinghuensis]
MSVETVLSAPAAAKPLGFLGRHPMLRRLLGHRLFVTGAVLLLVVVLATVAADLIAPYSPLKNDFHYRLGAPNAVHLMGTDNFGRDVLSRVLYGGRTSLAIGVLAMLSSTVLGVIIGVGAGYFSRLDNPLMRAMDALMAFPGVLLAIALASVLGPSIGDVVIALAVTYAPRTARIVRAAVLVVRRMEYIDAARVAGAGHLRIILRHVLPNCLAPLIVQMTFIFAVSILAEAVLSFVGVGPPPPTPSWGNIIADGRNYIPSAPWISLFPGLVIAVTVLGVNLIGDGLRDVLDPRLKLEGR